MDGRHVRRNWALVFCMILASVVLAPAASAAERRSESRAGHCVARLSEPDRLTGASEVTSLTCFRSFAAAIRHATGGRVVLAETARPADVTDAMLAPAGPEATVVIGIDWEHTNQGGLGRIWEASGGCAVGQAWIVNQIEAAWDNRISSGKGYNNCNRFEHYDNPNRTGALIACTDYCATMGIMNDKSSSLWWKHG
jgi:hypothetical protein